jgi:DNA recombination protein RmuC
MNLVIEIVLSGMVGLLIGWIIGRSRPAAPDDGVNNELRQQLAQREVELANLRQEQLTNRQQNGELEAQARFLNERLTTERQQIADIREKFEKEFEAISNKLLIENSSQFNRQSSESLEKLLAPFKDELKDFKGKLDTTQKETATHNALLKDQIGRIGTEAANLSKALKGDAKALGNWGENMLDQILEKSGLQGGLHFRRQSGVKNEVGEQRFLDVVVELPENKRLIIDSKVSLKSYEDYVNCPDEALRGKYLQNHVDCIRNHFRGLYNKRYQDIPNIGAPDFVLMYIPIEAAFFIAVGQEPGLFSEALERNVVLITNSTLLATMRTVAHVWKLADQQKNAQEIADRGGKLYDKFVGFITDLEEIGNALQKSHTVWKDATKKLHTGPGNLVRQAEQLKELGVKTAKSMPQIATEVEEDRPVLAAQSDDGNEKLAAGPLPQRPV